MNFSLSAFFTSFSFFLIYIFFILLLCFKSSLFTLIKQTKLKQIFYIIIISLLSISICVILISRNESWIYYWDSTMHWIPALELTKFFQNSVGYALTFIYSTLAITDYNWSMPLLYTWMTNLFGKSYAITIISYFIFYLIPALFLISYIIKGVISKLGFDINIIFIYSILCLTSLFYVNSLGGFLDAPVLLISSLLFYLLINYDYRKYDLTSCILISLSVCLLVVFRRHFFYFIFSLFIVEILFLIYLFINKKVLISKFLCTSVSILLIISAIAFFCLHDFLIYSMKDYYSGAYTSWNNPLTDKIHYAGFHFGYTLILFFISSIVILVSNKNLFILLLLVLMAVIPSLMISSAVMMHHAHFYLILLPVEIVCFWAYAIILKKARSQFRRKFIYSTIYSIIGIFFFYYSFGSCFSISKVIDNTSFATILHTHKTLNRPDVDVIKQIVSDLNKLTKENNVDVYSCGTSNFINYSILQGAFQPDNFNSLERAVVPSQSDLRDGFFTSFFDAGYVLVNDPNTEIMKSITYRNGSQLTEFYIINEIKNTQSVIGKHYEEILKYDLSEGNGVKIYKKISSYSKEDLVYLRDYFDSVYPKAKNLFYERLDLYINNSSFPHKN